MAQEPQIPHDKLVQLLDLIATQPANRREDYAKIMNVSLSTIDRGLRILRETYNVDIKWVTDRSLPTQGQWQINDYGRFNQDRTLKPESGTED